MAFGLHVTNAGKGVEEREPSYNAGAACGKQCGGSSENQIELPHNPAIHS